VLFAYFLHATTLIEAKDSSKQHIAT